MDQFDILDKTIREIQEKEDFSLLEAFKSPRQWGKMRQDQREALALLFVQQGSKSLEIDEKGKAFEAFSTAERMSPNSSEMYLLQMAALTRSNLKNRYHFLALEKGKKAIQLAPHSFPIIIRHARTHLELGIHQKDIEYLYEADRLFSQASHIQSLAKEAGLEEGTPDSSMLWMWGTVWHEMGKHSGEAVDFVKALQKYNQAEEEGLTNPYFYNDYGHCLVEQAKLMNNIDIFFEAIGKFQTVTVLDPRISIGWVNIAFLCEKLLSLTDDFSFFQEADYAYGKATEMEDVDALIWFRWAQLLYFVGCRYHKTDLIGESLGKFEKAETIQPGSPSIPSIQAEYADALALFGSYEEDLSLLQLAQKKIECSLQQDPNDPLKWYIAGKCHFELGEYFEDERLYEKASEKYLRGLELDKTQPLLWYGLAKCYHISGIDQNDPSILEQSAKFFSRAHEFGGEMSAEFWSCWGKTWLKIAELRRTKKAVKYAIEKYDRALELYQFPSRTDLINPDVLYFYAICWFMHGEISQNEGYFFKCIDVLKQLMEIHPHFSLAYSNLAVAYSHLGDLTNEIEFYEEAIEFYQQYLPFDAEDEGLWINWGITYLRMLLLTYDPGHPEENQKIVKEAEEKLLRAAFLGSAFAYYVLGCLYSKCQNHTSAIEYLKKAHFFNSLPPLSELRHDPWLEDLRGSREYKEFIYWLENH